MLQRLQEDCPPPPRSPSDPQKSWGRVVQPPSFSRAGGEVLIELGTSLFCFFRLSSDIRPLTVTEDVRLGGSQVESGEDLALVFLPAGISIPPCAPPGEEDPTCLPKFLRRKSRGKEAGSDSGRKTCLYPHFASTVNKPEPKGSSVSLNSQ